MPRGQDLAEGAPSGAFPHPRVLLRRIRASPITWLAARSAGAAMSARPVRASRGSEAGAPLFLTAGSVTESSSGANGPSARPSSLGHDGQMDEPTIARPRTVSADEWQQARDELLKAEKEATRALDALAARRRRLPMVGSPTGTSFDTPGRHADPARPVRGPRAAGRLPVHGQRTGRLLPRLHVVHRQRARAGGRRARRHGVSWVTVSNMPLAQIEAYKARRGWTMPFVVLARHDVRRRLRRRRRLHAQRVPARRRGRLPHVLHHRPRAWTGSSSPTASSI